MFNKKKISHEFLSFKKLSYEHITYTNILSKFTISNITGHEKTRRCKPAEKYQFMLQTLVLFLEHGAGGELCDMADENGVSACYLWSVLSQLDQMTVILSKFHFFLFHIFLCMYKT